MALRTLATMRTTVLYNCGSHSLLTTAILNDILQGAAREITEEFNWSTRQREAVISLVAPYTTGTLSATNGSATLTGSGTTWTAAMVGRGITIDGLDAYLRVATRVGNTEITLGDPQLAAVTWPGTTGSGLSYSIFAAEYALGSDVAVVLSGVEGFRLEERSRAYVDAMDPRRTSRGDPSYYVLSRARVDGSPNALTTYIEFWPVPSSATVIRVPYLCVPPALTGETDLPVCPSTPIEHLATARAASWLFAKNGDARWQVLMTKYAEWYVETLEKLKAEDEAKQPRPMHLGETVGAVVGLDRLAAADWGEDLLR